MLVVHLVNDMARCKLLYLLIVGMGCPTGGQTRFEMPKLMPAGTQSPTGLIIPWAFLNREQFLKQVISFGVCSSHSRCQQFGKAAPFTTTMACAGNTKPEDMDAPLCAWRTGSCKTDMSWIASSVGIDASIFDDPVRTTPFHATENECAVDYVVCVRVEPTETSCSTYYFIIV